MRSEVRRIVLLAAVVLGGACLAGTAMAGGEAGEAGERRDQMGDIYTGAGGSSGGGAPEIGGAPEPTRPAPTPASGQGSDHGGSGSAIR